MVQYYYFKAITILKMLWLYCKASKADFTKSKIFLQLTEDMPPSQFRGIYLTQQHFLKIKSLLKYQSQALS